MLKFSIFLQICKPAKPTLRMKKLKEKKEHRSK